MVEEAYVSFEVAKLLKEKGFDERCHTYFISDDEVATIPITRDFNNNGIYLSAPTQQMTMRWLREENNLYIQIEFDSQDFFIADIYDMIKVDDYGCPYHYSPTIANCKTYEEAVEAALKYCLENLI